jgi:hypothetical protein
MVHRIRSEFIKKKIKGKPFQYRHSRYIDSLIFIEMFLTGKIRGMCASYRWAHDRDKYPKEVEAIWKELDPKGYEKHLRDLKKEEEKEKKEQDRFEEELEKEEVAQRKAWIEAGGRG